jgi:hypothetical protein
MRVKNIWLLGALTALLVGCVAAPEGEDQSAMTESAPEEATTEVMPEAEGPPVVSEAFATPWPTGFTRRELADSALAKTFAFLDQRSEGASDELLTIVYQDTVLEFHQEWGTELAEVTIDSFADYLSDDTLLVVGTEGDFLVETLAELDRPLVPGFDQCCSSGVAGVAYLGTSWVSLPEDFIVESLPEAWAVAIIPHELFHNVQDSLDKGPGGHVFPPGDPLYRPVWLIEGSANYMGLATVAHGGYRDYWGNHFTATAEDAAKEDFILSRHEAYEGSSDPYSYGQLATEYIIASVGIEPLMNIWKLAGEGASFEDAFEEALGISVQDFYAAYDAMVESMVLD